MTTNHPQVFRLLDLSTGHLPEHICHALSSFDGVIATEREHGWFMWVPSDIPLDEYAGDNPGCPPEVLAIYEYAQKHDCQYVLFDADAEVNPDLPHWEW